MAVPKYDELFNPLLKAMHMLEGSGTLPEIEQATSNILKLSNKDLNEIHRGARTKFNYRLAWSRNYLKRYGLLENSSRGVWALTPKGQKTKSVDVEKVVKTVKTFDKGNPKLKSNDVYEISDPDLWKDDLLSKLKTMTPKSFEVLCQRVLRESGFIEVEVTGRTGDGGIDGIGKIRLGGFISFKVFFQCKRYSKNIGSKHIRDFRGAMVGRSDKGLFITTSSFTHEAKKEAHRDGAFPIDLIDGDSLTDKLKALGLGVIVKNEEIVEIDKNWFDSF